MLSTVPWCSEKLSEKCLGQSSGDSRVGAGWQKKLLGCGVRAVMYIHRLRHSAAAASNRGS
jgi:hypothetical protein